ncbi:MAG: hypothetical protein M1820_001597 [Bogoriella megaspora]|nr:MAG: hypothetical protein M1820_001597 [Bogoriella megaspora]
MPQRALPAPANQIATAAVAVTRSLPTTPKDRTSESDTPTPASTPGTWTHPRMEEISRRQAVRTFTEEHVQAILFNGIVLICTFLAAQLMRLIIPVFMENILQDALKRLGPYYIYVLWAFRAMLLYNVGIALSPLVMPKDDLSDIPLTPAQRKLLGLAPALSPAPPGSQYATPPRFPRSTPRSSERATAGSPLSGRSSPGAGSPSGSPYSAAPSPLLQKAVNGSATRRLSYGTPSPLSISRVASESSLEQSKLPSTPTPASANRSSVGLNNKWLYDRGRSNSRSSLFT